MVSLSRQLETQLLVQEFLFREADLLDRRHFREWLDMLAEDLTYKVPVRQTVMPKIRRPDMPPQELLFSGSVRVSLSGPKGVPVGGSVEEEFDELEHGMHYFDENKDSMVTRVAKL